jgi:hypothetical protein
MVVNIDIDRLIATYQETQSQVATAQRLGVSQSTVSKILVEHGLGVGKGTRQKRIEKTEVVALWNDLQDTQAVADRLGITQGHVAIVLRQHGTPSPRGHTRKYKLPMDELASLYRDGLSTAQIGARYNLSAERVRRRLIRHGVQMRTLKESVPRGPRNIQYKHGKGYNTMHFYRRQSYEVAAICLGRPLASGWVIHHMDENPQNNDPANLWLFPSQRHHANYHQQLLRLQRTDPAIDASRLVLENGGLKLPQPPAPFSLAPDIDPLALFDTLRTQLQDRTTS